MNSSQNRCVKYHHIYVDNATIEHNSKNVMAKVAKLYVYAHKRTICTVCVHFFHCIY